MLWNIISFIKIVLQIHAGNSIDQEFFPIIAMEPLSVVNYIVVNTYIESNMSGVAVLKNA
jgi:hypothetical protein